MFRRPWLSLIALILLGEWLFVKTSLQRIKAVNAEKQEEWEENIRRIEQEKRELAEKKRQDELERRLGWGYNYPYLPAPSYVVEYKGMQLIRPSIGSTTGSPYLYNGEIIQRS